MPITQKEILLILHMLFLAFFLGGQLVYLFIIQPASYKFFSINDQVHFMQNVLRRQNPVLLLALCLMVITGGLMITPIKGALGTSYFAAFGAGLIKKLGLFFIVFFITAYQTLSIGFKIRYLDPARDAAGIEGRLKQARWHMTVTAVLNVAVTVSIIFVSRHL